MSKVAYAFQSSEALFLLTMCKQKHTYIRNQAEINGLQYATLPSGHLPLSILSTILRFSWITVPTQWQYILKIQGQWMYSSIISVGSGVQISKDEG